MNLLSSDLRRNHNKKQTKHISKIFAVCRQTNIRQGKFTFVARWLYILAPVGSNSTYCIMFKHFFIVTGGVPFQVIYKETLCPSSPHTIFNQRSLTTTSPSSQYETVEDITDLSKVNRHIGDSDYAEVKDVLGRKDGERPVTEPIYVELESSTCGEDSGCKFSNYLERQHGQIQQSHTCR